MGLHPHHQSSPARLPVKYELVQVAYTEKAVDERG